MSNFKNNQYRIRVTGSKAMNAARADETLILTFSSKAVAMQAYRDMPDYVNASFPKRIETAVYRDSDDAVTTAEMFFS